MIRCSSKEMELSIAVRAGCQIARLENVDCVLNGSKKCVVYSTSSRHISLKGNNIAISITQSVANLFKGVTTSRKLS